jgi:orotate phosphoribosyltransferase
VEQEIAQLLLAEKAVTLNPKSPYVFASGIRSPIYCDNRTLISSVQTRERILKAFLQIITEKNLEFDMVAGIATAGIPWAAWLAERLKKPLIYVRGKAKEHGKRSAIEGRVHGNRALVVEDLISTGGSSRAAIDELQAAGVTVAACVAIFTYEMRTAAAQFAECPLYTLTRFSVLINEARSQRYLTSEEATHVLTWNADPEHWAERMGL